MRKRGPEQERGTRQGWRDGGLAVRCESKTVTPGRWEGWVLRELTLQLLGRGRGQLSLPGPRVRTQSDRGCLGPVGKFWRALRRGSLREERAGPGAERTDGTIWKPFAYALGP